MIAFNLGWVLKENWTTEMEDPVRMRLVFYPTSAITLGQGLMGT
jgi:hypothetical protein